MMSEEHLELLIKKSVKGQLSESERELLDQCIASNANIKKQLEDYEMLSHIINESKLIDVRNFANKAHKQALKRNKNLKIAGLIGAIALFSIVGILTFNNLDKREPKTINPVDTTITPLREKNDGSKKETIQKSKPEPLIKYPGGSAPRNNPSTKFPVEDTTATHLNVGIYPEKRAQNNGMPQSMPIVSNEKQPQTDSSRKMAPCINIQLKPDFFTQATCAGEALGSIVLDKCTGGQQPYKFTVFDLQNSPVEDYRHLNVGKYKILISDANSCSHWNEVFVPEKNCPIQHTFNPFIGETWEIPQKNKKGHLKIVDKKGIIYFSQNLSPEQILIWDGKSSNGDTYPGFYQFFILYEDNSTTNGTVTIIE